MALGIVASSCAAEPASASPGGARRVVRPSARAAAASADMHNPPALGGPAAAAAAANRRRARRSPAAPSSGGGSTHARARSTLLPLSATPPDVVCVGEALFDLIADQKGVPRERVDTWTGYPGGAPCNVATAAARLGARAAFVSALGRDARGDELVALLRERGVDVSGVQRPEAAPTRAVYVVRTADGDREFSGFGAPTDTYSDCFLDAAAVVLAGGGGGGGGGGDGSADDANNAENAENASLLASARCLVTGTLGLAYPASRRAIEAAAEAARAAGAVVLVDVNWRPVFWPEEEEKAGAQAGTSGDNAPSSSSSPSSPPRSGPSPRRVILDFLAKYADVVKVSDADLEYLCTGVTCEGALSDPCALLGAEAAAPASPPSSSSPSPPSPPSAPSPAPPPLLPLPSAVGVLVTAGEKGASYCFRAPNKGAHSGFVPAYDVKVADTTGAGDAFTAGFLWWMLMKKGGGAGAGSGGGASGGASESGGASPRLSGREALFALASDPAALADAVAFGAATGALTCTRPGAIASQPTLEEVMALFEEKKQKEAAAAAAAASAA